jgi:hypothetical protein
LPKVSQFSRTLTPKKLLLEYSILQMAYMCLTPDLNWSVSGKEKCLKMTHMRRN